MSIALTGRWDDKYDVCECGWYRHYHGILLDSVCQRFVLARSAYNHDENPPAGIDTPAQADGDGDGA